MFNIHDFVFETILGMIGKEPEYKVRQYALGWLEKNVLANTDLSIIDATLADYAAKMEEAANEGE